MARISAGLIGLIATACLAPLAVAQFGQQFELPPLRPPGNIPSRPEVPPAPQVTPPAVPPANVPAPQPVRPEIQTQTLPPPPPPAGQRPPVPPAAGQNPPPPAAQNPTAPPGAPPQPSLAQPEPPLVEPPTPKIANPTAVFAGLDKITGRITTFDVAIDETVRFGALEVTPRVCYTRPPTELPQTDGFVEVDELTLQGELRRIFTGWMFAASPGLNAVEHPIYDIWLTDCKGGGPAAVTVQQAAPAEPAPPRPAPRPRPQRPLQPAPGVAPPAAAPPAQR